MKQINKENCDTCIHADDCDKIVCNHEPVIFYRSGKTPTIDESQHPYDAMLKSLGG